MWQSANLPAPTIGTQHWPAGNYVGGVIMGWRPAPPLSDKPEYRIPLMGEIDSVEKNGYRLVSTFSGCGGSCLGFRWAGFETLWASEFIEPARHVYEANHPGVRVNSRDIRTLTAEEVLEEAGLEAGEVDVLEGSPPCAGFSLAGTREKAWGKEKAYSETRQRDDDLFLEFARILKGVQPRVFVAENVKGLVIGKAKGYFKIIHKALTDAGYDVAARVLDAQWLGVPQHRERVIFVGVRNDLGVSPAHPEPLPYRYSILDALPHLGRVTGRTGSHFERVAAPLHQPMGTLIQGEKQTRYEVEDRVGVRLVGGKGAPFDQKGRTMPLAKPLPTVAGGQGGRGSHQFYVEGDGPSLDGYALGEEYDRLKPGGQSLKYFSLVRPLLNEPCPCVTQSGGTSPGTAGVVHPTEKRKFTIAELKRLSGFPDDFVLSGSYSQQWERIGRAVPPPMMYAIACVVRDEILRKVDEA